MLGGAQSCRKVARGSPSVGSSSLPTLPRGPGITYPPEQAHPFGFVGHTRQLALRSCDVRPLRLGCGWVASWASGGAAGIHSWCPGAGLTPRPGYVSLGRVHSLLDEPLLWFTLANTYRPHYRLPLYFSFSFKGERWYYPSLCQPSRADEGAGSGENPLRGRDEYNFPWNQDPFLMQLQAAFPFLSFSQPLTH